MIVYVYGTIPKTKTGRLNRDVASWLWLKDRGTVPSNAPLVNGLMSYYDILRLKPGLTVSDGWADQSMMGLEGPQSPTSPRSVCQSCIHWISKHSCLRRIHLSHLVSILSFANCFCMSRIFLSSKKDTSPVRHTAHWDPNRTPLRSHRATRTTSAHCPTPPKLERIAWKSEPGDTEWKSSEWV